MSLCPDCYIDEHMGHPKKRLEEVFKASKKRIDEQYDTFKEQKYLALRNNIIDADAQIIKLSEKTVKDQILIQYTDLLRKAVKNQA